MKTYEFDTFNEYEYLKEIKMEIIGISKRERMVEGKKDVSWIYHLAQPADYGYKPFYDFWSRDCIIDAEVGMEVEPILSTYNGQLKIFGLKLIGIGG